MGKATEEVEGRIKGQQELIARLESERQAAETEKIKVEVEESKIISAALGDRDVGAEKKLEKISEVLYKAERRLTQYDKLLEQERQALAELFRKWEQAEISDSKSERAVATERALNLAPEIQEHFAALAPLLAELFSLSREIAVINDDLGESTNETNRVREAVGVALVIAIPELQNRVVEGNPDADTPEYQKRSVSPLVNISPQMVHITPANLNESLPAILGRFLEHQQPEAAQELTV